MHFDDYPDETLVDHAVAMKTAMDHYRQYCQDASDEIMRRCRDREATMLRSPTHTATLKTASPTYDLERLNALRELLGPEDLKEAYTAAHEETRYVAAKWHGGQLNKLVRQHGADVRAIVDAAKVPGAPSLVIESRNA